MSIRLRIVLIVLPLIITSLLIAEVITSLYARNGITLIATQFLQFKSEELTNYAQSQWNMIVENGLEKNDTFINASQTAVESFAQSLIRKNTETIYAVDSGGTVRFQTQGKELPAGELQPLREIVKTGEQGWEQFSLEGVKYVAWVKYFKPFGWTFILAVERNAFYQAVDRIFFITVIVIAAASVLSVILLLIFSHYLTLPLRKVVSAMRDIISTNDLSKRVDVIYKDETGELGHSFNLMVSELQKAYDQIKGYALKVVIAQHKEQKIRNIFQKYVPKNVIDQFFMNPESMLIGQDRVLAVLFSDIRSFTTISEQLEPNEIVESLNLYFSHMVDIIMNRDGIVDKYIGDAIMAFYGAPVRHEDDALQAVLSGIEMIEALEKFNIKQEELGRPEFRIGVGINYGLVTVGNIGSEKKMDYTVIGDMVNLASRLEGLTKKYGQPLLISESVYEKVKDSIPCRLLDKVVVKGKKKGVGIYAPKREAGEQEKEGWEYYEKGLEAYAARDFRKAAACFAEVEHFIPGDINAAQYYKKSEAYILTPPPDDWQALTVMTEK